MLRRTQSSSLLVASTSALLLLLTIFVAHAYGTQEPCAAESCRRVPLTHLQKADQYGPEDYTKNLLDPKDWVVQPGGNVSYFNLTTTPALEGHGIAFSLAMLAPCGIILPHIHPRGTKGIYLIQGEKVLVGFVVENKGQTILNNLTVGSATFIPRAAVHWVMNLGCTPSAQLAAYNYEDPGLLTLGANLMRFPDAPIATGLGLKESDMEELRALVPKVALDYNRECRARCESAYSAPSPQPQQPPSTPCPSPQPQQPPSLAPAYGGYTNNNDNNNNGGHNNHNGNGNNNNNGHHNNGNGYGRNGNNGQHGNQNNNGYGGGNNAYGN